MRNLVKVHMLPTEDKTDLGLLDNQKLGYIPNMHFNSDWNFVVKNWKTQHLYFTSDEEIVGGKEIYYIDKFINKVVSSGGAAYGSKQQVIVATTDKKLTNVPQISNQFQEEYVKAGGIDEVLLELELSVLL